MKMTRLFASLFLALSMLTASLPAAAKPFCALRDPSHTIFELFPEADNYYSLVENVDKGTKEAVLGLIPFTIHNKEIGKHTIYVAQKDGVPVGIVHVRTEPGEWGLVEIAWALHMDLKVRDYRFQRCRETGCDAEPSKEVLHKDLQELLATYTAKTDASGLPQTVLKSAMKTVAITQLVWGEQIQAN